MSHADPQWVVRRGAVVTDAERGFIAWLTVPTDGEWSDVVLSYRSGKERKEVKFGARWRDGKLQRRLYQTGAPCNSDNDRRDKPCA